MSYSGKYRIGVYVFYFGKWPDWIDLYWESLRRNPSIDFHVITDCEKPLSPPANVKFHEFNFPDYLSFVNNKLGLSVSPANALKLCDIRPFLGFIHKDLFYGYDFYGWTDVDLLFGDIRSFYTDEILNEFDVLSTHSIRISGHLALFRNTARNRGMYKKIYDWKNKLEYPHFVGLDEHGITNAYTMTVFDRFNEKFRTRFNNPITRFTRKWKARKLYMVEQYTTPFTSIPWLDGSLHGNQPSEWYYKDGAITNNRDGARKFLYLHFMNFKNSQWRHDGSKAPWEGKNGICAAKVEHMSTGLVINEEGINPIQ